MGPHPWLLLRPQVVAMPHTLLLIQATKPVSSRTYRDFQTITQAADCEPGLPSYLQA